MKPTPENINTMLNSAYYQGKEVELYGQEIELPADIPAYFDWVEARATGLPDEFASFERGLNRWVHAGRHAYKNGDEIELRKRIWGIKDNLRRLEKGLIDYRRVQGTKKGGKAPKRQPWAEMLADRLAGLAVSFPKAWATIPEDENAPLELDEDTNIYRINEGEIVVAEDSYDHRQIGRPLTRLTFQKHYFQKAKQNRDSN